MVGRSTIWQIWRNYTIIATRGIPDIDQLKNENEDVITEIRTRGHNFPSNVSLARGWSKRVA